MYNKINSPSSMISENNLFSLNTSYSTGRTSCKILTTMVRTVWFRTLWSLTFLRSIHTSSSDSEKGFSVTSATGPNKSFSLCPIVYSMRHPLPTRPSNCPCPVIYSKLIRLPSFHYSTSKIYPIIFYFSKSRNLSISKRLD